MFEIAELGHKLAKKIYQQQIPKLRTDLLKAQEKLKKSDFSVIILVSGVDGGGKGEVINLLNEWMDARYMRTTAFSSPTDEEQERPKFWRYWRTLPAKGSIGIYVGSWYSEPLSQRVYGQIDARQLETEIGHISQLEKLLVDDHTLIIKCWLHLKKSEQKKRLLKLESNPETKWRVTKRDKQHLALYDDFVKVAEIVLSKTSTAESPWLIIDGTDIRYSSLTVGKYILSRMEQHLLLVNNKNLELSSPLTGQINTEQEKLLDSLDLSLRLDDKYRTLLSKYQTKLGKLSRQAQQMKKSSVLVFEGWDAAGKGGAIRRITRAIDARTYQVIPIAAPSEEALKYHYLWRFWQHIPRSGQVTIYDRSWYGRVLVERIEGYASQSQWQRSYSEIVNFEQALTDHGTLLLKFWLHIDKDEQLRRFKERETISYKQYKITDEDYRNREKWDEYSLAVNEMVIRTSTLQSPWVMVESNDKKYARIKVLKCFCEQLEKSLDRSSR